MFFQLPEQMAANGCYRAGIRERDENDDPAEYDGSDYRGSAPGMTLRLGWNDRHAARGDLHNDIHAQSRAGRNEHTCTAYGHA